MASVMNPIAAAWPVDPCEMKLRLKYRTKKASNKGTSKKNNSGGNGRKALSAKRARSVNSRTSPEQYGRWAASMKVSNEPILG
jgi:hypothetical protein